MLNLVLQLEGGHWVCLLSRGRGASSGSAEGQWQLPCWMTTSTPGLGERASFPISPVENGYERSYLYCDLPLGSGRCPGWALPSLDRRPEGEAVLWLELSHPMSGLKVGAHQGTLPHPTEMVFPLSLSHCSFIQSAFLF